MTRLQDIEKNVLLSTTDTENGVDRLTSVGVYAVDSWLRRNSCWFDLYRVIPPGAQYYEDAGSVIVGDNELKGKLAQRIIQYVRITQGMSLNNTQIQELSSLIASHMFGGNSEVYYDVVEDIDWQPGDFGENRNSCWWTGFVSGKNQFIREMQVGEAAAIRLLRKATEAEMKDRHRTKWYDEFVGYARCFAVVNNPDDVDIIFNGYGIDLEQWKNFIVSTLGYKHGVLLRESLVLGGAYVNGGSGWYLYDNPSAMKGVTGYRERNFGTTPHYCSNCNRKFRGTVVDGLCEICWNRIFMYTTDGTKIRREDALEITVNYSRGRDMRVFTCQEELDNGVYQKCGRAECNNFFQNSGSSRKRLCPDHRKPAPKSTTQTATGGTTYRTVSRTNW